MRKHSLLAFSSLALLALLGCGCSGGGGGSGVHLENSVADLTVALDSTPVYEPAPSPSPTSSGLSAFEVDVRDITLQRVDGRRTSVLPTATRVDFVALGSLAELITGRGVPPGAYAGLDLTLDFTSATVVIEGQSTPATVVDRNGTPITGLVPVHIDFAAGAHPQIVVNRRHLLELTLDLDASVTVDGVGNRVAFDPTFLARPDPALPHRAELRGALAAVQTGARTFTVDKQDTEAHHVTTFTVTVDSATVFQIDGVVQHGDLGLQALAAKPVGTTQVTVRGAHGGLPRTLDAAEVLAGAGAPGSGQDRVTGLIVGRDLAAGQDASLRVLGSSHGAHSGHHHFATGFTVAVQLGPTRVLREGSSTALTTDALDVGQRVEVFGQLDGTTLDATGANGLPGVVRQLPTTVLGTAVATPANNTLRLQVERFEQVPATGLDFLVGGVTEADPNDYRIDVTGLDTSGVVTDARVSAIGFTGPVGVPNDADFTALSLADRTPDTAHLMVHWAPPSTTAFSAVAGTGLELDLTGGHGAVVDGTALTPLGANPPPQLVPAAGGGCYVLGTGRRLRVFTDFPSFVAELQTRLAAGARVHGLSAGGSFVAATQVFTARTASVLLH